MDPAEAFRAARRAAGLSQRGLAARAGVALSLIADVEAGRRQPGWGAAERVLRAAELELGLMRVHDQVDDLLRSWLTLSTTQRLYMSLGGRYNARYEGGPAVWRALAATRPAAMVLPPVVSMAVWLPGMAPPVPLPVLIAPSSAQARVPDLLAPEHGPWRLEGLVPVGVGPRHEVHVLPPDAPELAGDPRHGPRLRAAARLLHDEMRKDEAGRRAAAHRDSDPVREYAWLQARRRFDATKEWPDPRSRRDWRLAGEPSFRDWLARRGHDLRDRPDL